MLRICSPTIRHLTLIKILLWNHVVSSRISTYTMVSWSESYALEGTRRLCLLLYCLCCAEKKKSMSSGASSTNSALRTWKLREPFQINCEVGEMLLHFLPCSSPKIVINNIHTTTVEGFSKNRWCIDPQSRLACSPPKLHGGLMSMYAFRTV